MPLSRAALVLAVAMLALALGYGCHRTSREGSALRTLGTGGETVPSRRARTESFLRPLVDEGWIPGAIVAFVDADGVEYVPVGATTSGGATPPDEHTLYGIGAIADTFAALLVARADDAKGGECEPEVSDRWDVMRARILEPLGLVDTVTAPSDAQRRRLAVPHDESLAPLRERSVGAPVLRSTAHDLARVLQARLGFADTALAASGALSVADARGIAGHGGTSDGYHSEAWVDVDDRIGVVLLTNAPLAGAQVDLGAALLAISHGKTVTALPSVLGPRGAPVADRSCGDETRDAHG